MIGGAFLFGLLYFYIKTHECGAKYRRMIWLLSQLEINDELWYRSLNGPADVLSHHHNSIDIVNNVNLGVLQNDGFINFHCACIMRVLHARVRP